MNVEKILTVKGDNVISIEPTAKLVDAARLLSTHRIGAVVIVGAGGRLSGILSERDIVRAIAGHGAAALEMPVSQEMTRNVMTCVETDSVADIMEKMTTGKFRHLPVLRDGKMIGLVSIGDVVKHRVGEIERESEEMRDYIRTA